MIIFATPGRPTPAQAAAGNYAKPTFDWHGLTVAIENPEGTVREGIDETGKPWRTVFKFAYGEFRGTCGVDGDPVDVYVGQYAEATEVYVVRQMKRKQWGKFDEDKCFINFRSMDDAKAAYLEHYDDPRFFGGVIALPVSEFVTKVRATRDKPDMIKAVIFFKSHVGAYLRGGKLVNTAGYQGRAAHGTPGVGQLSLFSSNKPLPPSALAGKHPVRDTPDMFADEPKNVEPKASATETNPWVQAAKKGAFLPPADNYQNPDAAAYVREWGEFQFGSEDGAQRYADLLESGEGGKWEAVKHGGGWRAHRVGVPLSSSSADDKATTDPVKPSLTSKAGDIARKLRDGIDKAAGEDKRSAMYSGEAKRLRGSAVNMSGTPDVARKYSEAADILDGWAKTAGRRDGGENPAAMTKSIIFLRPPR